MSARNWFAAWAVAATLAWAASAIGAEPRVISDAEVGKIEAAMPEKAATPKKPHKVLVFYRTEGFFHGVIPLANKAFEVMGQKTGAFETVLASEMSAFDNLDQYDAVLFNNTTALKFENPQHRANLLDFVKSGRALIGVHAATDNFYNWPEAAALMGGLFSGHPWGGGGTWAIKVDEPAHPLNRGFNNQGFWVKDELYQFRDPYSREKLRVLLSLDMSKQTNQNVKGINRADNDHAVSWIQEAGGGRVFYCSLGHNDEIFYTPAILQHYLDGIQWALGDLEADAAPSAKLTDKPAPALAPEKP